MACRYRLRQSFGVRRTCLGKDEKANHNKDRACNHPNFCMAVGSYAGPSASESLIETWNGESWSIVPSPNPGTFSNYLNGISCNSANFCTAVGDFSSDEGDSNQTLIESWNGASWSVVSSPNFSYWDILNAVSCSSISFCIAAGNSGNGNDQTLAEEWNGLSWSIVPSVSPGSYSLLNGISCISLTSCVAVGYQPNESGDGSQTLVETWNGTNWEAESSPNRGTQTNVLNGISCYASSRCTAVGWYQKGQQRTLIEYSRL